MVKVKGGYYMTVTLKARDCGDRFLAGLSTQSMAGRAKGVTVTREYSFQITIDSPTLSSVITIGDGEASTQASNEHGEADYAIWHHCIHESSRNIVVVSLIHAWVYGLGLCGQGHLEGKHIIVRRGNVVSYIDITAAALMLSQHSKLSGIAFPVLSLVTLYVLTGCDYVSSFYRCSKTLFMESLLKTKGVHMLQ